MGRVFRIVALTIGLTAFAFLTIFGLAIWVFIPLFPAAIVFVFAVVSERRRSKRREPAREVEDYRKAA